MAATPNRPNEECVDARDVASVLGIKFHDFKRLSRTGVCPPSVEVSPERLLVYLADLDAWERRKTLGESTIGPRLSVIARRTAAERLSRHDRNPTAPLLRNGDEEGARRAAALLRGSSGG